MTTHVPQPDELPVNATSASEPQAAVPSQPMVLPDQSGEGEASNSQSFYIEDEPLDLGTSFVAPFQLSNEMPTVFAQAEQAQPSDQAPAVPTAHAISTIKPGRKLRLSLPIIAILVCVVVIGGLLVMNALAQTTPPLQTRGVGSSPTTPSGNQQKPTVKIPTPIPTPGTNGQGQGQPSTNWVPQQLPNGWTNAGRSNGDAIQAFRTSVAFNDREMSLDYRSVGTRNTHGGTFTAATFLLTPAARQRFMSNDVREINNTLFDMVTNTKLIRLVINPQPQLVQFVQQGQQQFAWVDVAFQLWQSQLDPNNPKIRTEGVELDPTTHQPRTHHMTVLLLRVPPQDAGVNPAMGGTGWLVSNYGLDLPNDTDLAIVQPA